MKNGWLINDTLTCIPGTKTFWHDLLENIPGLTDKTNGYTDYANLRQYIESEYYARNTKPDYLIRNATFFNKINLNVKTISLLQDICTENLLEMQLSVCNSSNLVVFNSPFTKSKYSQIIKNESIVIPLGVDFNLFKPEKNKQNKFNILENSILYVGSSDFKVKGFDKVLSLINDTKYNFCLVMKDDFKIENPRVKVFNKINHEDLVQIINSCSMMICTSNIETQHLAGIEAAACNLPIISTNVGVYYNREDGDWGRKVKNGNFKESIDFIFKNINDFSPRKYFLREGYDKKDCMKKWNEIISAI